MEGAFQNSEAINAWLTFESGESVGISAAVMCRRNGYPHGEISASGLQPQASYHHPWLT